MEPARQRAGGLLAATLLVAGSIPGVVASQAQETAEPAGQETGESGAQVTSGPAAKEGSDLRPVPATVPAGPLTSVDQGLPVDPSAVESLLADELTSSWLGPEAHLGITVRDVGTGQHLLDRRADTALVPASLTKLLTASAIVQTLPMDEPFVTRVVAGSAPDQIVLVAGGDMLLARGAGKPEAVAGRAGLGDLADQTVEALTDAGMGTKKTPVQLRLDTTYAAGPRAPEGWTDFWLANGYTGPITMLGAVPDRALVTDPAPADPAGSAAVDFRRALQRRGVVVAGGKDDPVAPATASPKANLLGAVESAPARDVLALALADSDNAMVEQLARQAAVRDGAGSDPKDVAQWVINRVGTSYGVDTTRVRLGDASGLSDGTRIPVSVVADLLVLGAGGAHPELQSVLSGLPIAGYTGTLWDRFRLPRQRAAVGIARAKTGTLPQVSGLAGVVVTRDGRLLAFAIEADEVGRGAAQLEAQAELDQIVADLASCGC